MCELRNGTITTKQALIDLLEAGQVTLTPFHSMYADMTEQAFANEELDDAMRLSMKDVNVLDDNNFWMTRERLRFDYPEWGALGGYRPHPMFEWIPKRADLFFHFPHASTENPVMVAYTPSIAYGINDRQRRCTAESYIKKFYPDTSEETLQLIRANLNGELKVLDHTHIVQVYKDGPSSCMSGVTDAESEYGVSPAKAYELEEWGIAVIMEAEKIVARAIVRPKEMSYVRCYGDAMDLLHKQLSAAGYTRQGSWPSSAKLKLLEMSDGNIVAPYLDGGRRGVCINGGFLCLNGDDYSLEYASGYFNPDETETAMCDYCEDSCDPDEMIFTYDEQSVCNNCREEHFRYAYVSTSRARGWVHADNVVYCESNSEYYLDDPDVLSYHDIAECTVSGDYFKTDDMCSVEDGWAHADYAVPLSYNDYDYCLASDVKPVWFVYVIDNKITSFIHPDDVDKDDECHMSIEAALAAGLESDNDSINAVLSNFISTFAKAA